MINRQGIECYLLDYLNGLKTMYIYTNIHMQTETPELYVEV